MLEESGCNVNQTRSLHLHLYLLVVAVYFHVNSLLPQSSFLLCLVCLATSP